MKNRDPLNKKKIEMLKKRHRFMRDLVDFFFFFVAFLKKKMKMKRYYY